MKSRALLDQFLTILEQSLQSVIEFDGSKTIGWNHLGFWLRNIRVYLFGVVEALEVVLSEERAVLGLPAAGHALAEVSPKVVAPPLVPCYPPTRRH